MLSIVKRLLKPSALFLMVLSPTALAQIELESAYVRAMPSSAPNSGAFMVIHNSSDEQVKLIGAQSSIANKVELHTHKLEDGMMKMRQVEFIAVPKNGKTELKPGGLHIMLIGLKRPVTVGEQVELSLQFDDGTSLTKLLPIKKIAVKM